MIDIIIPCYNSKNVIFDTLCSIMSQNYNDLKVYLVNDGNKDEYQELVDFFINFFDIKLINVDDKKGIGRLRNIGFKEGNSTFVMFLDSNIIFPSPISLRTMINQIDDYCDYVNCNYYKEYKNKMELIENDNNTINGKIFKRKFLEVNNIIFNEENIQREDIAVLQFLNLSGATPRIVDKPSLIVRNIKEKDYELKYKDDNFDLSFVRQLIFVIKEAVKSNKNDDGIRYITKFTMMYYYFYLRDKDSSLEGIEKEDIDYLKNKFKEYNFDREEIKKEFVAQLEHLDEKYKDAIFMDVIDNFRVRVMEAL
jgi:glycosyltransferase involved in cell wall biosynthesis